MATPLGVNHAGLDAAAAAEATGGRVTRSTPGRLALGLTIDSRAVTPGGAFVALRGERHDGHAFLQAAIEAGAVLLIVGRGQAPADPRADAVEVDDTLEAWGAIARRHVLRWREVSGGRVIGITGSAGKTTTKEMCAALLRTAGDCLATAGNLNNRVGLPAMALELEPRHHFAVLEMGMSLPGEIAALAAIADPDVGVVVNVGLAHAGGLGGTLDDVAREKGALFAGVRPGGTLVANLDDARVMAQADRAGARRVTFGRGPLADVRLVERDPLGAGGSAVVVERRGARSRFSLAIPGEAAAIDLVAALAAAEAAAGAIPDDVVSRALETLAPIPGRMHVQRVGDVRIVDDSYNANPASMRAALAAIAEMSATRRVAVLGEMKELGPRAEGEHEALGEDVARAGVHLLVSCGGLADAIARTASLRGVRVVLARDASEAARLARDLVRAGDLVLVKASRSVGAERVAVALTAARAGS